MRIKLLLTIAIIFSLAISANAQINKGSTFLGGSLGYASSSFLHDAQYYNDYKNQSASATVQAGKVIKANTIVGFIVSYNYINEKHYANDSSLYKVNQYSAGIFYRKYKRILKDFYFWGEVEASYLHSDFRQDYYPTATHSTQTGDGIGLTFVPGLSYAVCKKMQLELVIPNLFSISYNHLKTTDVYESIPVNTVHGKQNNFSASINLDANLLSNLAIGFKFIF